MLKRLQHAARERAGDRMVTDVRMGLCYTAAQLDDGSTGVALTFRNDIPQGCSCRGTPLAGQPAAVLLAGLTDDDLIARTVALAVANAVLNRAHADHVGGDTLEMLRPTADDVVGMVGYFGPLVPPLEATVRELRVFEKVPEKAAGVHPEAEAYDFLPDCTIAIITSTSLLNRTTEPLLEAARACPRVALVGSSTPLAPAVFADSGVTLLSGIVITDPPGILQIVSECGGTRSFKGHVNKVNMTVAGA